MAQPGGNLITFCMLSKCSTNVAKSAFFISMNFSMWHLENDGGNMFQYTNALINLILFWCVLTTMFWRHPIAFAFYLVAQCFMNNLQNWQTESLGKKKQNFIWESHRTDPLLLNNFFWTIGLKITDRKNYLG